MDRSSLIRRVRRAAPEAAFALLLGAALVIGGGAALAGLPKFLDATLPDMQAQALTDNGVTHGLVVPGVARLVLPQDASEAASSRNAPQVLYPVTGQAIPGWLADAVARQKNAPLLRTSLGPSAPPDFAPRVRGPVIAICIDDLGEDLAGTDRAMALPRAVALSFLPYADTTPALAEAAAREGHLVLAHVPMQALGDADPGPETLKVGMPAQEIAKRLGWDLSRVPGLVGVNNHEGSRFTADAVALAPVMATLKARHLFFFDSRTGPESRVPGVAAKAGVLTAGRDVFLDDDRSPAAVRAQLDMLVREAKRNGVAIAIGHPHDVTLRLLSAWLKKDHGVTLIPLDEAMRIKAGRETSVASK